MMLIIASRKKDDPNLGKVNPTLDDAIRKIQAESPHLFWQEHELKERKFYDEPAQLSAFSYKSFVVPNKNRFIPKGDLT
jgi:hypothetical protein